MPAAHPEARGGLLTLHFPRLLRERHVAFAVSGGSDSTALMRLVHDWARAHHPTLAMSVLTVDHGLRPAAADEARQAGTWAAAIGLPHHILKWQGDKPQSGIQAKARQARYDLMTAWCRSHGAGLLLTAHTLDDQAETVLMRLNRTRSPDSLSGIAEEGAWQGFPLLRPLLGLRREPLRRYLRALGQGWIDDPSNEDRHYERVRVRQSLTELAASGVTAERLAALAGTSARAAQLLERLTNRWLACWLVEEDAGICHVPAASFQGLPPALKERILGAIVRHYGGGSFRPEPAELRRLLVWAAGEGPQRCTLAGALLGRRKAGFWVTREAARIAPAPFVIPVSGEAVWDGRFRISAAPGSLVSAAGARAFPGHERIPAFARRAFPVVEQQAAGGERVKIDFLRLAPP